ncbi:hypothetical protein [Flavobacterium sp.]|uniref:hypothetical protein n=1 Tax=Flavobacterium sp. TaxID=239 RepID=UPI0031D3F762|nr:hypothetical protein [Flavobacterium collinsii]
MRFKKISLVLLQFFLNSDAALPQLKFLNASHTRIQIAVYFEKKLNKCPKPEHPDVFNEILKIIYYEKVPIITS